MADPEAVVEAYFRHGRDADCLAPEVELRDQASPGVVLRGRQTVAGYILTLYHAFAEAGMEVEAVGLSGAETVVAQFTFRGRRQQVAIGPLHPRGRSVALPMLAICRVKGGRIRCITLYYDAAGLSAQLGDS